MKLKYYKSDVPNFGDDLNAALWPKLAPTLFDDSDVEAFVGIGTIIGFAPEPFRSLNVFSSGAGNNLPTRWEGLDVTYWCVRGPITARFLGLAPDRAISDGAVLTPLATGFPAEHADGEGVLIIPHWQTLEDSGWDEAARLAGFELLDPRGTPEAVVARIARARLVLTESLHGAILADTYGVPWAAFATSGHFQTSKWCDWTLSVGREFAVTVVPPPTTAGFLRYGRPIAPLGHVVRVNEEAALANMRGRSNWMPPNLRARAKAWLKRSGLLNRFYGMSASRTAEALTLLASGVQDPTSPAAIKVLQARMLDRLDQLGRHHRK